MKMDYQIVILRFLSTVLRWPQEIQQAVEVDARYRESTVNYKLLMLEDPQSWLWAWVELLDEAKTHSSAVHGKKGLGDVYVDWGYAVPVHLQWTSRFDRGTVA